MKTDKKIDEVLNGLFSKNTKLSRKYRNYNIEQIWREVFGTTISKYTTSVSLYNKKLTVYLSSAPLRQELTYRKATILETLNQHLEYLNVEELIIK